MHRNIYALIVGTTLVGAAALASCGGGGSTPNPLSATGNTAPVSGNTLQSNGSGLKLTLTISNATATPSKKPNGKSRASLARRRPAYIDSSSANGLQLAVSGGGNAKTVYADISSASALCTPSTGNARTCTLTVPTVAATETITATEVDQTPTSDGTNGNPAGYGSGFPTTSNILAAGTATTPTNTGSVSVSLGLSPVLAYVYIDCVYGVISSSSPTTTYYSASIDFTNPQARLVVTGGVAQTLVDCIYWYDADGNNNFNQGSSPLPLVDVNASPEPLTLGSSSQGVTVYALPSPVPTTNPSPTATSASITSTSYMEYGDCFFYTIRLDGTQSLNPMTTLNVSSNLQTTVSPISPFPTSTPYPGSTNTAIVVPLTVSGVTGTVAVTGGTTGTVTASDYQGGGGLVPYGSATNTNGLQYSAECVDSGGTEHASVASAGSINTTNWQQVFTITPVLAGTCSFVLVDYNTLNAPWQHEPVITPAVSVTVGP